jgi:tRNA(Ile)-lysidine synthase
MSEPVDLRGPFSRLPAVRSVERYIREHGLFESGETVLVGVSGGADSVFALLALLALHRLLGLDVHVAHLNHGWRGNGAAEDARFVAALAQHLQLPFHGATIDTKKLARDTRRSPEDAAREARYRFFATVCLERGIRKVVTGHNQDDQIETYLIAWLRGSGPAGLAAMAPCAPMLLPDAPHVPSTKASLCLVRPLLSLSRRTVRRTLTQVGQAWREDPSNEDPRLLRSRVRAELVPLLESLSPGFRRVILRSAMLSQQAGAYLERQAAQAAAIHFVEIEGAYVAPRHAILALDPALQAPLIRHLVDRLQGHTRDLEWAHVEGALRLIRAGRGGASTQVTPAVQVRLARGQIVIARRSSAT